VIRATKVIDGEIVYQNGRRVMLTGRDAVAQRLKIAIQMRVGEFSLAPLVGIDWFTLNEKGITLDRIRSELIAAIQADEAVVSVQKFEIKYAAERSLQINFIAQTTEGEIRAEENL
jgi:hypothetical protein